MTPDRQHKLAVLAAQQAEDAFAQYGLQLTTDVFNSLCDHMAELARRLVEDGPDACADVYPPVVVKPTDDYSWE